MKIKVKSKNLLFYSRLLFNFLSFRNDFLIEYNLFKQSIQKVQYGWIEFQYKSLIMLCMYTTINILWSLPIAVFYNILLNN